MVQNEIKMRKPKSRELIHALVRGKQKEECIANGSKRN